MSKTIRSFFPAMLIAALSLCLPAVTVAQSDPGSLDDLLGADFEPLQTQLNQQLPPQMESVMETPRVTVDAPPSNELVLPDLTMPTPENTAMESREFRRSLKAQLEPDSRDQIELLPYGAIDGTSDRIGDNFDPRFESPSTERPIPQPRLQNPQPRLQSPQALNYGSRAYSSRSRIQFVPIQVEFYSSSRSFGYQPYGGYRSSYGSSYRTGYRPYGGYVPYGGYGRGNDGGRYCPYSR